MEWSLIAFDTDHVKRYVFGTDKLKEIRGASSLLDYLNRIEMKRIAKDYGAISVYAHGGSGLFLIESGKVDFFGKSVQQAYRKETGGGSSIQYVSQTLLLDKIKDSNNNDAEAVFKEIGEEDISDTFALLQWKLQKEKLHPPAFLTLATHPFLRLCDACGIEYADASDTNTIKNIPRDPDEQEARYCTSCLLKRVRDHAVKKLIEDIDARQGDSDKEYLWHELIPRLRKLGYDLPPNVDRPTDFNVFRAFKGTKDYLGLIYADANNMGNLLGSTNSLGKRKEMAHTVDDALYESVCTAITNHLKIADHRKPGYQGEGELKHPVFPFDILLLGGDDICMVVPASVAMDVALTVAETFRSKTQEKHTLSVSVVLAPVKYPFGLLQEMAETTLKFAKKVGADARTRDVQAGGSTPDDTRINFLLVTGGSSNEFEAVYNSTYHRDDDEKKQDFDATLRPYAPTDLKLLLDAIRDKDGANLGRTKLHQMREAIFQMNLTTSVSESLAVLRNWRARQRDHVVRSVYNFAGHYQMPRSNPADPVSGFPPVIFPWFANGINKKNGHKIYRTPLLDFIELYDFLSREGGDKSDED